MSDKMPVGATLIASVGIIYRAVNPAEIFIELKDDSHPIPFFRRKLCFIGGNWIGDLARYDNDTLETFQREIREELSLDRPIRETVELALLGLADVEKLSPVPISDIEVNREDTKVLEDLKFVFTKSAISLGDFLNTIPKAVLDAADPENQRDGFSPLVSCWTVALTDDYWKKLLALQKKFGNLSNESVTLVTSLQEIIQTDMKIVSGLDRVLQHFFLLHGVRDARKLPLVPGIESIYMGAPLPTYRQYLKQYQIAKNPIV